MNEEKNLTPEMEAVYELLKKYGFDAAADCPVDCLSDLGVDSIEDLAVVTVDELVELGLKKAKARRLIEEAKKFAEAGNGEGTLAPMGADTGMATVTAGTPVPSGVVLPEVPDNETWMRGFKVAGKLLVNDSVCIALVRAGLAEPVGISKIPEALLVKLELEADKRQEPAGPSYWRIVNAINQRKYADVLSALTGGTTPSITVAQRKKLMARMSEIMLPALERSIDGACDFLSRLVQLSGVAMGANLAGGVQYDARVQAMLQALTQVPDTGEIHELADDLRDAFNKTCSGTGMVTATKIAMEYAKVKEILDDPELYALCNVANRDQLVREMNLQVSGALVRTEESLVQFVYAMIRLDQVPPEIEPVYVVQMCNLAARIDKSFLRKDRVAAKATTRSGRPAADAIEVEGSVIEEQPAPLQKPKDTFLSITGEQLPAQMDN